MPVGQYENLKYHSSCYVVFSFQICPNEIHVIHFNISLTNGGSVNATL